MKSEIENFPDYVVSNICREWEDAREWSNYRMACAFYHGFANASCDNQGVFDEAMLLVYVVIMRFRMMNGLED